MANPRQFLMQLMEDVVGEMTERRLPAQGTQRGLPLNGRPSAGPSEGWGEGSTSIAKHPPSPPSSCQQGNHGRSWTTPLPYTEPFP